MNPPSKTKQNETKRKNKQPHTFHPPLCFVTCLKLTHLLAAHADVGALRYSLLKHTETQNGADATWLKENWNCAQYYAQLDGFCWRV